MIIEKCLKMEKFCVRHVWFTRVYAQVAVEVILFLYYASLPQDIKRMETLQTKSWWVDINTEKKLGKRSHEGQAAS